MACGIMVVKSIQGRACSRLLRILFDSGGSRTMIRRGVIPEGAQLDQGETRVFDTLAGAMASLGSATVEGMRLPAFNKNRVIAEHKIEVFDAKCNYDMILGGDFLA